MWALLAAIGSVVGLATLASVEKSDDPVLRPALQRGRLARILESSGKRRLTLAEAEDGLVLSRRLGKDDLAKKFGSIVQKMKSHK